MNKKMKSIRHQAIHAKVKLDQSAPARYNLIRSILVSILIPVGLLGIMAGYYTFTEPYTFPKDIVVLPIALFNLINAIQLFVAVQEKRRSLFKIIFWIVFSSVLGSISLTWLPNHLPQWAAITIAILGTFIIVISTYLRPSDMVKLHKREELEI